VVIEDWPLQTPGHLPDWGVMRGERTRARRRAARPIAGLSIDSPIASRCHVANGPGSPKTHGERQPQLHAT
jgi:hypothetical protein